jgi:pyridoxamine 5'-phosphate oxidase
LTAIPAPDRGSDTMGRVTDHGQPLREEDVDPDPLRQFTVWHREAEASDDVRLAEAVALATASADGAPSVRMVLLKGFDERGFVFYSNYDSRKGRELAANPRAALLFHWDVLGRQVRIEGPVARTSAEETAAYVRERPRGSQLSALASPQSQTIDNRQMLERRVAELEEEHTDRDLPLPENWGGFRLAPETFELWQQRKDRLHDRLSYRRDGDAGWLIERLAP